MKPSSTVGHGMDYMKKSLKQQLSEKLEVVFANPDGNTWAEIRKCIASEIHTLTVDQEKSNEIAKDLRNYARNFVEEKVRKEAQNVLQRMQIRYASVLCEALVKGNDKKETAIIAWSECITIMSNVAVIRLDEEWDVYENKLFSFYKDGREKLRRMRKKKVEESNKTDDQIKKVEESNKTDDQIPIVFEKLERKRKRYFSRKKHDRIENILYFSLVKKKKKILPALASTTWPQVSSKDTLITPATCKLTWEKFQAETLTVTQAFISGQEAIIQAERSRIVNAISNLLS